MCARKAISTSTSLPAPTGGWNARDSLAEMSPLDAPILQNWYPSTTECIGRNGYSKYAYGFSGQCETLIDYAGASNNKLFCIASGNIYDITSAGAVGGPSVTGLSNSRFQFVNVATPGGNYLMCVNGIDKLRYFDGATWSADGGTYTITGLDTRNVIQINLHKNRVWMIENSSLKAWYLPTLSIAGAANYIDMSSVAYMGGYIAAMGTWTIDAGDGVDDYAVFITSRGQVMVYQGTDPASAATWALKGVWQIGAPVGRRCFLKYSGDILIVCQDGLFPMSGALQSSRVNPKVALTDKIQYAMSNAVSTYGDNFGWQILYFPKQNQIWLNIPIQEGQNQQQYVMNTINKSWCNYDGWEANCWVLYKDDPYFGGNGFVGKAWDTLSDDGQNISCDGLQAFNYFSRPGLNKRFMLARPVLRTSGNPSILVNIDIDFDMSDTTAPLSYSPISYAGWDLAIWDSAIWGGGLNVIKSWQGIQGIGKAAAIRMKMASQGVETHWASTDIVFEVGGIL